MENVKNKINETMIRGRFFLNQNRLGDDGIGVVEVILILLDNHLPSSIVYSVYTVIYYIKEYLCIISIHPYQSI